MTRHVPAPSMVWTLLLLAALPTACVRDSEHSAHDTADQRRVEVLRAPASPADGDLDLHQQWSAAEVRQDLGSGEERWSSRPHWELVIRNGEGHRALLMLPSRAGAASTASFRVALPASTPCELVAWLSLETGAGSQSDGLDYTVAVLPGSGPPAWRPEAPPPFERLEPTAALSAWREVRLDLSGHAGHEVWIVLAVREEGERRGDWLLWGDPRIRVAAEAPLVIDLARPEARWRRPRSLPWSEANVFKAYAAFGDAQPNTDDAWMQRLVPWVRSIRLFSSLGANWGPSLERDYERQVGANPTAALGPDTRWARHYEFFRDGPAWEQKAVASRFDWSQYDALLDRAAASGPALHVHMAGAPEAFTNHRGSYQSYHYNEAPVVDEQGWKSYVDAVFTHLASRPWYPHAHFSFFSEPNCVWVESDGTPRRFGFQGTPEDYARQYLWTWQAMRAHVRPDQIHFGPWVVEPAADGPVVDNLEPYVRAIVAAFAAAGEPLPPWSAFAFNIYETPRIGLDSFAAAKIAQARRIIAASLPGEPLPLRFDEVGIHPLLLAGFEKAVGTPLEDSRWATAWHAEMAALMVEQGIVQGAPWVSALALRAIGAYVMLSRAVHALDFGSTHAGAIVLERPAPDAPAPADVWVRPAARAPGRLGYLWSSASDRSRGATRALALSFLHDERARAAAYAPAPVEIRLPSGGHDWRVSVLRWPDGPRAGEATVDTVAVAGLAETLAGSEAEPSRRSAARRSIHPRSRRRRPGPRRALGARRRQRLHPAGRRQGPVRRHTPCRVSSWSSG